MRIDSEKFEDKIREEKNQKINTNQYSKYRDLIFYHSSLDSSLTLAMLINKPSKPSYILVETHGWHMSIPKFVPSDIPSKYLVVSVDMRGRAFSSGNPDCNGYELFDVYDAINYVKEHYKQYIKDPNVIYFECGSGGGGNAFELVSKFPDLFAACTSMCGISDYLLWYKNDKVGEFKDELDVWIGNPNNNETAYYSRSGLYGIENLYTPIFIAHGTNDERVPHVQSLLYKQRADLLNKGHLVNLYSIEGVGGFEHFQNITPKQQKKMEDMSESNRLIHNTPIEIPKKGQMIVKGYIITKYFKFFLDSIDDVSILDYDIDKNEYHLTKAKWINQKWQKVIK